MYRKLTLCYRRWSRDELPESCAVYKISVVNRIIIYVYPFLLFLSVVILYVGSACHVDDTSFDLATSCWRDLPILLVSPRATFPGVYRVGVEKFQVCFCLPCPALSLGRTEQFLYRKVKLDTTR